MPTMQLRRGQQQGVLGWGSWGSGGRLPDRKSSLTEREPRLGAFQQNKNVKVDFDIRCFNYFSWLFMSSFWTHLKLEEKGFCQVGLSSSWVALFMSYFLNVTGFMLLDLLKFPLLLSCRQHQLRSGNYTDSFVKCLNQKNISQLLMRRQR